ncbi:substrate-binding periplasmic protein [Thalassotalea sediminis]|uniref:substrate-binding periplasmic protein n=1 Tax=Thalassotalea sediminis TaxID=1759089 RepID=UPI002573CE5E|nr:transporter substrate-binding domain-containing protein [Thalassotalea sediminis]
MYIALRYRAQYYFVIVFQLLFFNIGTAKELNVAVSQTLPPYVLPESNSGIEIDLFREAMALKGYEIRPFYVPFARLSTSLKHEKTDVALTLQIDPNLTGVHYSQPYIFYRNVVVSLKKRQLQIDKIEDLKQYSILAFQNAAIFLGEQFHNITKTNRKYVEIANQQNQVHMLYLERVDAIIMDEKIFHYFRQQEPEQYRKEAINIHPLFVPIFYHVGFKDEKLRDAYDNALNTLKGNGRYQEIINSY